VAQPVSRPHPPAGRHGSFGFGAPGSGAVRHDGTGVSFGPTVGGGVIGTSTFGSLTDRHGSEVAGATAEDCTVTGDCTAGDATGESVVVGSVITTAGRKTVAGSGGRLGGTLATFAGGSSARQVVVMRSPGGDATTTGAGPTVGSLVSGWDGGAAGGGWSGGRVGVGFTSTGGRAGAGFDSTGGGSACVCVEPAFGSFANTLPGMRNVCPVEVSFTSAIDAGRTGWPGEPPSPCGRSARPCG